ncbi:hypothetical protein [Tessaracoccus massiliensis]|uniref:hypothetical protein n=1 Tax=Tessaracoccus massiliensis TaxID=1522311 RepID=UPI00058D7860|nr:hypothetical protein [Tessaracoccus massiliensis]
MDPRKSGPHLRSVTLVLLAGAGLLLGCTPSGQESPAPSPVVTEESTATSSPSEPTVEPSPELSGDIGRLPDEEYPAEIDGYTLVWTAGAPSYDIERATVAESERISVLPTSWAEPAGEDYGVQMNNPEELRPGVWCYVDSFERETCHFNGSSGRSWGAVDEFDTLTFDELAAWCELFAAEVP